MRDILTAEKFLILYNSFNDEDIYLLKQDLKINNILDISDISTTMIEFAKFHVGAALKKASQEIGDYGERDLILNSYPLKNIK